MIASRRLLLPLVLLLVVLATFTTAQPQPQRQPAPAPSAGQDTAAEGNRVFSYYYGQAHGLRPWEQPAEKLTHVIFSFFNILDDGTVTMQGPPHTAAGIESVAKSSKNMLGFLDQRPCNCQGQCLKGELWQTHLLKTRYPHLKTIMSIGGWTWSDNFSVAFSTAAGRRRVVETSQQLMEQFGFDGLDIDFEFPGMAKSSKDPEANKFWQSSVNDWQNMAAFFTEARAAYGNKYSLSAALPGLPFGANTAWPSLGRTLDYALIMAYENNHMPTRAWGGGTLRSVESDDSVEKIYNVKAGMDDYVAAGIPRNKLILGIPLYGTGFSGLNRNMRFRDNIPGFGVDIRANNLVKLPPTGYNKIMEQVQQGGWTKTVDERRGITVYFNGSHVWFVDTPETIRIKGEYAKQERLGGIMYWNANQDLLPSDPNSLMSAAAAAYPVDLNPPHKRKTPWCVQPEKTPWCNLHCGYVYPEGNNLTLAADMALSTAKSRTGAGGLADVNTGGFGAGKNAADKMVSGMVVMLVAVAVSLAVLA